MAYEALLLVLTDYLERQIRDPAVRFPYPGFEWLAPLPGPGLKIVAGLAGVCALLLAAGVARRPAAALFTAAFAYLFVLERALYQNHFYLICLLGFLFAVVPAGAAWRGPVPAWTLALFRFQVGIPYVFGGIAKLNADWLLRAQPLRVWLEGTRLESAAPAMAWASAALDLGAVPLLLWRRTRPWAFGALAVFHLLNAALFPVGIFPWLMLAATTLFFDPDWPERAAARVRKVLKGVASPAAPGGRVVGPLLPPGRPARAFVIAFAAIQILVPLRQFAYPGATDWTEEGRRFSWRMMSRRKVGWSRFTVRDPASGTEREVDPNGILTRRQAQDVTTIPDMTLDFARWLAEDARRSGVAAPQVFARCFVQMNRGGYRDLVDRTVDLAREPRRVFTPYPWILR